MPQINTLPGHSETGLNTLPSDSNASKVIKMLTLLTIVAVTAIAYNGNNSAYAETSNKTNVVSKADVNNATAISKNTADMASFKIAEDLYAKYRYNFAISEVKEKLYDIVAEIWDPTLTPEDFSKNLENQVDLVINAYIQNYGKTPNNSDNTFRVSNLWINYPLMRAFDDIEKRYRKSKSTFVTKTDFINYLYGKKPSIIQFMKIAHLEKYLDKMIDDMKDNYVHDKETRAKVVELEKVFQMIKKEVINGQNTDKNFIELEKLLKDLKQFSKVPYKN